MIVNFKTKQKSKTIVGRIRNVVLDFILYFVTAYTAYILYFATAIPHTCNMSTG